MTFSDLPASRVAALRARKKVSFDAPTSRKEAITQMAMLSNDVDDDGKRIFTDIENKIVAVTYVENIIFLTNHSQVALGDGTFTYAPRYFIQTYTVHVCINNFYVHVASFFLPSKHASTYTAMWRLLKKISLGITGKDLTIISILLDYEIATHNGARIVFPGIILRGCRFHLGQSWWKRIYGNSKLPNLFIF